MQTLLWTTGSTFDQLYRVRLICNALRLEGDARGGLLRKMRFDNYYTQKRVQIERAFNSDCYGPREQLGHHEAAQERNRR